MQDPLIIYDTILALSAATVTATDTDSAYDVANLYDYRPYTHWLAASSGTKRINIDAGSAVWADSLGINTHNLNTVGVTVSVEKSTTGAWAGEEIEVMAGFAPSDDLTIAKRFTGASSQYWSVKLAGATAAPKMAMVLLGDRLDFPQQVTIPHTPLSEGIVLSQATAKRSGHPLGVSYYYGDLRFNPTWAFLPDSFATGGQGQTDDFETFWDDHGKLGKPFIWCLDTDNFSSYLVWVDEKARFEYPIRKVGTADRLTLLMRGVAE